MKFLILAAALLAADTPTLTPPPTTAEAVEAAPKGSVIIADDVTIVAAPLDPGDTVIVKDAVADIIDIVTNGRAVGGFALAAAILGVLFGLTKLGALRRLFEARGITWARPALAAIVGGLGALFTALANGVRDPPGLIFAFGAGVFAAFGAVGAVATVTPIVSPVDRTKVRVTSASLDVLNAAAEEKFVAATVAADAATGPVRAAVAASENLPAHKRAEALAGLLNKAPVSP